MGSSYGIECSNCDYSKEFETGIGMLYSPENILDFENEYVSLKNLVEPEIFEKAKTLVDKEAATLNRTYGHSIYRCQGCGEFYNKFLFSLNYNNSTFTPSYKCPTCNSKLTDVLEIPEYLFDDDSLWRKEEIQLEKYQCPKCNEYKLKQSDVMIMWD